MTSAAAAAAAAALCPACTASPPPPPPSSPSLSSPLSSAGSVASSAMPSLCAPHRSVPCQPRQREDGGGSHAGPTTLSTRTSRGSSRCVRTISTTGPLVAAASPASAPLPAPRPGPAAPSGPAMTSMPTGPSPSSSASSSSMSTALGGAALPSFALAAAIAGKNCDTRLSTGAGGRRAVRCVRTAGAQGRALAPHARELGPMADASARMAATSDVGGAHPASTASAAEPRHAHDNNSHIPSRSRREGPGLGGRAAARATEWPGGPEAPPTSSSGLRAPRAPPGMGGEPPEAAPPIFGVVLPASGAWLPLIAAMLGDPRGSAVSLLRRCATANALRAGCRCAARPLWGASRGGASRRHAEGCAGAVMRAWYTPQHSMCRCA